MDKPRMNLYGFAHKGLRNALSQLSLLAGSTDFTDKESLENLKSCNREVVTLLDLHSKAEDNIILAALEARSPGSTVENIEEHEQLEKEVEAFDQLLKNISPASGPAYYTAVNSFQSKYIVHMAMEENDINPIIWKNFTDDELLNQQGQVMASFTPEQTMMWLRYIVPAQNPLERTILIGGLRANAPSVFFEKAMAMLQTMLTEKEYLQLESALNQTAVN